MKASSALMTFSVIFSMAAGQLLFKIVANNLKNAESASGIGVVIRAMSEPLLWPALLLYGMTTILWIALLRQENISLVYPLVIGASILIVTFFGIFLFQENPTPAGLIGGGFILTGLVITALFN